MKTRIPRIAFLICTVSGSACADVEQAIAPARSASVQADEYQVVDLGTFGAHSAAALAITDNGTVVGGYFGPGTSGRSFRLVHDEFEDLGDVDGIAFQVLSANNRGDLSGCVPVPPISPTGVTRPVIWTRQNGFAYLDDANHGGRAWAINNAGEVAGVRFQISGQNRGFFWSPRDGLTEIAAAPASTPARRWGALNLNDGGEAVGGISYELSDGSCCEVYPFVWDRRNGMRLLPRIGGQSSEATDINNHSVVVGAGHTRFPVGDENLVAPLAFNPGDVPVHAWRWTERGGMEDLGTLGGPHSVAWAVDAAGNAYGWAMDAGGVQHAALWPASGGVVALGNWPGRSSAQWVNQHGVAVGRGFTSAGHSHALVFAPH